MTENDVAKEIVDAAYKIHLHFGPGLLESAYEAVLKHELTRRNLSVVTQYPIPIIYEGVQIDVAFRADMLVEDKVLVELKSLERLSPVHGKQLLTYLRLADKRLGLLINFGTLRLKDGIVRVANNLIE